MTTEHTRNLGPLAQFRHAAQSPVALALGAVLGAFVPCSTFVVVHLGGLLQVRDGAVTHASWEHPGWALVLGGLGFSATTVYRWGCSSFRPSAGALSSLEVTYTHGKALFFVLLIEGVLMLAPIPALSYVALALLVLINALSTGAALALRDHADRETVAEQANTLAAPAATPAETVSEELLGHALPARCASISVLAREPVLSPVNLDRGLYSRAKEAALRARLVSAATLRRELHVSHAVASALVEHLVSEGVLSETKNTLGQRPVLLAAG